jgi:flagellar hook-associated protein 3 FlgL
MRVTDKMSYNQVTTNLQKNRTEMSDLQNQAATQKRVTKPSDDPIASAKVLAMRSDERGGRQFVKNIDQARSFLEATDESLSEMSEILMRAKELAIQQANDAGSSHETRRVVAEEIKQIYSQAVQIGNRKLGERYIFGGTQTTHAPFDHDGRYYGDEQDMKLHINKDAFIAMNLSGDKVFLGKGIGADGLARQRAETPRDVNQLKELQQEELQHKMEMEEQGQDSVKLRGPASEKTNADFESQVDETTKSVNILQSLSDFETALRVDDKNEIQEAIDNIDYALAQVVHSRAQVGARIQTLNSTQDSLHKGINESKVAASQLEDADLFQVVSDISKTDSTLKASLETSGKVITPSLLDFLK